jgi:hypothetical protein
MRRFERVQDAARKRAARPAKFLFDRAADFQ